MHPLNPLPPPDERPSAPVEPWQSPWSLDERAPPALAALRSSSAMHVQLSLVSAKRSRRRMRWLLAFTFAIFVVMVTAWVYLQDEKPVVDLDLTPEPPLAAATPPRAPDRLRLMLEAVKPIDAAAQAERPVWEWETPLLASVVQANAAAFDNLRDLLSESDWQPRHPQWLAADLGSDARWASLGAAKSAAIAYFARRGEEQAALQVALDLAVFAKRLQGIRAWPDYYPRGIELHQRACEAFAELLRTSRLSSYQLGQFQLQFEGAAPSDALLQAALKSYYQFERRLIVGLRSQDAWDQVAPPVALAHPDLWFFRPNATLHLFYKAFKGLSNEMFNVPYARTDPLGGIIGPAGTVPDRDFSPNAHGLRYAHQRLWSYGQLVERQGLQMARHRVVLSFFTVKRFAQDKGRLPQALAELVPAYFTELPVDPYSGKALGYDATRGLLYSAGVDVHDAGGHLTSTPLADPAEPTVSVK